MKRIPGTMGVLWDKNICICFIRPTRYTYQFAEKADVFTLSFFDEQYRDTLSFCGSQTGRNVDKVKKNGLTPVKSPEGSVYFAQTRLVIECKKIYFHDLNPRQFLDPSVHDFYAARDYHRMYIGEVIRVLAKETTKS